MSARENSKSATGMCVHRMKTSVGFTADFRAWQSHTHMHAQCVYVCAQERTLENPQVERLFIEARRLYFFPARTPADCPGYHGSWRRRSLVPPSRRRDRVRRFVIPALTPIYHPY